MEQLNLTFPQSNIFMVDLVNKNTPLNVIAAVLKIKKNFKVDILKDVINQLFRINDALRINILSGENPKQIITDYKKVEVKVTSFIGKDKEEVENYLDNLTAKEMDIYGDSLIYMEIIKLSEDSGLVYLKMHHIISDAWTFMQITSQLINLYNQMLSGGVMQLSAPSYLEFIDSENEYINSEKYLKDEEFWREYTRGISDPVSLKEKSSKISSKANRYSVTLNKELNDKILSFAKGNRVSPYTMMLSALATYVYRIKDVSEVVIGTPILNRSNFKEKNMLGCFISTIPMRIKITENMKFFDLVKETSNQTMTLFRHQRYPISKTIESIHKNSDVKGKIYNMVLSYQNARLDLDEESEISTEWIFSKHIQDELEIHVSDMDSTGILTINYDYLSDLFEEKEIEYLHTRLMAILENVILDKDVSVEDIRIMTKEEEDKILYEFNNTDRDYPKDKTVAQLFEEQVVKTPNNVALVFEGKSMTYDELNKKANGLAHYLEENYKIGKNSVVGIKLDKSFELIISILSVLKLGACYMPIDMDTPESRIAYMIDDSNSCLVIDKKLDFEKAYLFDNCNLNYDISWNDNVYIMYTSGTTGNPKGVMVNNRNIIRLVKNVNYLEVDSNDVISQTGSIAFDASTFETWMALLNGLKLCLVSKNTLLDFEKFEKYIKSEEITIMWLTSPLFNQIVDANISIFANIKYVLVGGDVLSIKHINKLLDYNKNIKIINGYGPTENTTFSTTLLIDKKYEHTIPIGRSISNSKCYVIDSKNRLLPIFVEGELLVSGDGVANGYIGNEELTNSKFIKFPILNERAYKTGDICKYTEEGIIKFIGRNDNQVKIRGFRVELDEIKNKLLNNEKILECYVYVDNRKELIAFCKSDVSLTENDIKNSLKNKLPNYMIPSRIIILSQMPLNQNGKVDFKILLKQLDNSNNKERNFDGQMSSLQKEVLNIFEKRLDRQIGLDDDFFTEGGDSLSAINLSMDLSSKFNKKITYSDIVENSTVYSMSEYIKKASEERENIIAEREYYPLSKSQLGVLSSVLLNPNSTNYNIPLEILINSSDVVKYVEAIKEVLKSNISLFNKIFIKDGKYVQKACCLDEINLDVKCVTEEEYHSVLNDFVQPFNIIDNYLFRIKIVCIDAKKISILLDFHHIIFDGSSLMKFLEQLKVALSCGKLEKNTIEFGQLVHDDNENTLEADNFYSNKFTNEIMKLDISNNNGSNQNDIYEYEINSNDIELIMGQDEYKSITAGNLFLSIFTFILSKYSYSDDIIIGTSYSGRENYIEQNIMGMFVKNFPVRFNIDPNFTFVEYAMYIQEEMKNYIRYSNFSLDKLLKKIDVKRTTYGNVLYDIMFIYQSLHIPELDNSDKIVKINELKSRDPKLDIIFNVYPLKESFKIVIEYNSGKITKERISSICAQFELVIKKISTNVKLKLCDVDINSNIFNNKIEKLKDVSIVDKFYNIASNNSEKIAVVSKNEKLTYDELNKYSNIFANYLTSIGVKPQEKIAISISRNINLPVVILGILKSGACYVPIDKEYPIDRKNYILNYAKIDKIIINRDDCNSFANEKLRKICVEDVLENYNSDRNIDIDISKDDLAYIIFTSGTTGNPKAVMIKHESVVNYIEFIESYLNYGEDVRAISVTTISFDIFVFELFTTLCLGSTLFICDEECQKDPKKIASTISKEKIQIIMTTPSRMKLILAFCSEMSLDSLKYICLGGEVFPITLLRELKKKLPNARIYNCYGPTETTVYSAFCDLTDKKAISIGKPIKNTNIILLDKYMKIVPEGALGQIAISGLGVTKGYLYNEELNKKSFIIYNNDNYYLTGDIGRMKDNELQCIGRIDTQVKIRGYRVELEEINQVLEKNENISSSVTLVKNINNKNVIVSYFVANSTISNAELIRYLKEYLPSYMIPNYFKQISQIPITPNGKVDKRQLDKIKIDFKLSNSYEDFDENELIILSLFKEVLKLDNIQKNDNFFEIGGDSLLAMELVLAASRKNIIIEYADIFNFPTIELLAQNFDNSTNKYRFKDKVESMDFSNIDLMLSQQKYVLYDKPKNYKTFLVFGATGFLGIHIMTQLLDINEENKIICVVRGRSTDNSKERLFNRIKYYYGAKYECDYNKRIIVINGDITDNDKMLGMLDDFKDVDIVINAAAIVKHFGNFEEFYDINLKGTNNIIELCEKLDKPLIHISTTSVSGDFLNRGVNGKHINYNEKSFYINQSLENNYIYTKFMAEYNILNAVYEKRIKAKIMRMGNLMGRYDDGMFQFNFTENAFVMRIKALIDIMCIPKNLINKFLEFTPIDYAAKAISNIIFNFNNESCVFHINNPNYIKVGDLLKYTSKLDININVVDEKSFADRVRNFSAQNIDKEYIYEIVTDIGKNNELNYDSNIIVNNETTIKALERLGFYWPKIDKCYIERFFKRLKDIGYLEDKNG